jgi:hypothetical protein
MAIPTFTQSHFRLRNDNGSESSATWIAAVDTNGILTCNLNFRVRFVVHNSGGNGAIVPYLYYSLNSGGYSAVSASSTSIKSIGSLYVSDNTATTNQLSDSTFTYAAGGQVECGDGQLASIPVTSSAYIELEFCLSIPAANVANGDSIALRVYNNGIAINTYAQTPVITVSKPTFNPAWARRSHRLLGGGVT